MGHRLVKDDSPGSIGPTRTGVRMAVLTDRAGGASSMSKAMMEGGREPRVAACARAWTTLWKALGQACGTLLTRERGKGLRWRINVKPRSSSAPRGVRSTGMMRRAKESHSSVVRI